MVYVTFLMLQARTIFLCNLYLYYVLKVVMWSQMRLQVKSQITNPRSQIFQMCQVLGLRKMMRKWMISCLEWKPSVCLCHSYSSGRGWRIMAFYFDSGVVTVVCSYVVFLFLIKRFLNIFCSLLSAFLIYYFILKHFLFLLLFWIIKLSL